MHAALQSAGLAVLMLAARNLLRLSSLEGVTWDYIGGSFRVIKDARCLDSSSY